jgi:hypothetical protein
LPCSFVAAGRSLSAPAVLLSPRPLSHSHLSVT